MAVASDIVEATELEHNAAEEEQQYRWKRPVSNDRLMV